MGFSWANKVVMTERDQGAKQLKQEKYNMKFHIIKALFNKSELSPSNCDFKSDGSVPILLKCFVQTKSNLP